MAENHRRWGSTDLVKIWTVWPIGGASFCSSSRMKVRHSASMGRLKQGVIIINYDLRLLVVKPGSRLTSS
ncbi:hypothetical protein RRG08_049574 [Elysia crispata]|uniref:Uncharacterized protein n=1 Tax=Elysia crispata TaxID=231223 RepID=A0AAE1E4K9_9GAST|nr:hypothetical protein RRG08_049574 [Elysia crispata]